MLFLVLFAFLAGVVTILSPCILPILPIVLSGSVGEGKRKPLGVIIGFVLSFTFFTLFLSSLVQATGLSADALRTFSVVVILLFGISLLLPQVQVLLEQLFSKMSQYMPQTQGKSGLWGGILIGMSLGLIWTPCVGPILASVISLAFTGSVSGTAVFITLAYSLGTAIPMFAIMYGGRNLLNKVPWLLSNTSTIQKAFGVLMILTAIGIFFNLDRRFQTFVLDAFPNYGKGLTQIEDNELVRKQLDSLKDGTEDSSLGESQQGTTMDKIIESDLNKAPEIIPGGQWYNLPAGTEELTLADLRGKVVLVDFWTYTCINCIRTLPYLRAWHEQYADQGLMILGVHTPEFEFEKDPENLRQAIADYELKYPIVQDNEFATWRAYNNRYWPAKYLIDAEGKIRYTHFGEGAYEETEEMIRTLLEEAGETVQQEQTSVEDTMKMHARSPETYLGAWRIDRFSSPEPIVQDTVTTYTIPSALRTDHMAYGGEWEIKEQYARPAVGAELAFQFEAEEVFLVMRPIQEGTNPEVQVVLDNTPISVDVAGEDVQNGTVVLNKDRLYKLIRLPTPQEKRLLLRFPEGGVELYAFTFG